MMLVHAGRLMLVMLALDCMKRNVKLRLMLMILNTFAADACDAHTLPFDLNINNIRRLFLKSRVSSKRPSRFIDASTGIFGIKRTSSEHHQHQPPKGLTFVAMDVSIISRPRHHTQHT